MPDLLLPYLAVIAVLTITPGPDMLLVLRNGVRDGTAAAWATGLGCCTGIAVHAALAVLGSRRSSPPRPRRSRSCGSPARPI
jgi:threonine/homoserine/homoserine lactone efflux protein